MPNITFPDTDNVVGTPNANDLILLMRGNTPLTQRWSDVVSELGGSSTAATTNVYIVADQTARFALAPNGDTSNDDTYQGKLIFQLDNNSFYYFTGRNNSDNAIWTRVVTTTTGLTRINTYPTDNTISDTDLLLFDDGALKKINFGSFKSLLPSGGSGGTSLSYLKPSAARRTFNATVPQSDREFIFSSLSSANADVLAVGTTGQAYIVMYYSSSQIESVTLFKYSSTTTLRIGHHPFVLGRSVDGLANEDSLEAPNFGNWASQYRYEVGQLVRYNGSIYVARTINSNSMPTDTTNWLHLNTVHTFGQGAPVNANDRTYMVLSNSGTSEAIAFRDYQLGLDVDRLNTTVSSNHGNIPAWNPRIAYSVGDTVLSHEQLYHCKASVSERSAQEDDNLVPGGDINHLGCTKRIPSRMGFGRILYAWTDGNVGR